LGTIDEIKPVPNSTYNKLAVQCLNEHLCFVSRVVLADSFALRNRQLLKPANRYRSLEEKTTTPTNRILNDKLKQVLTVKKVV